MYAVLIWAPLWIAAKTALIAWAESLDDAPADAHDVPLGILLAGALWALADQQTLFREQTGTPPSSRVHRLAEDPPCPFGRADGYPPQRVLPHRSHL